MFALFTFLSLVQLLYFSLSLLSYIDLLFVVIQYLILTRERETECVNLSINSFVDCSSFFRRKKRDSPNSTRNLRCSSRATTPGRRRSKIAKQSINPLLLMSRPSALVNQVPTSCSKASSGMKQTKVIILISPISPIHLRRYRCIGGEYYMAR